MLVLKRKEGQWVEVIHKSGDVIRIRVCAIEAGVNGGPAHLNLLFDGEENFRVARPETSHLKALVASGEITIAEAREKASREA